jgi:hypothetical protein
MGASGPSSIRSYRDDLHGVVGSSVTAYRYTLAVWSAGAVLSYAYGPPSPPEVLAFFAGAVAAFALVGVLAFVGRWRSSVQSPTAFSCGAASALFRWGWW